MSMKTCKKCGETFPLTEQYFQKRKDSKDGFRNECKACRKSYLAKYKQKNSEKIREMDKKYNQINRDKRIEYKRTNRDRLRECDKLYKKKNRELIREQERRYRKRHPEIVRLRNKIKLQRYKAKVKRLPRDFTKDDWINCLEYFNNECAYCGVSGKNLEQDHFVPVNKGGGYTKDNIVPACKSCNGSKQDNDFEAWYSQQPFCDDFRKRKLLEYLNSRKELMVL